MVLVGSLNLQPQGINGDDDDIGIKYFFFVNALQGKNKVYFKTV